MLREKTKGVSDQTACLASILRQVTLSSSNGGVLAEAEVYVVVEAVNDAPSVVCPKGTIVLEEDAGPTNIPGVYVTDPDAHETRGVMEVSWPSDMKQEDATRAGLACKRVHSRFTLEFGRHILIISSNPSPNSMHHSSMEYTTVGHF